MVQWFRDVFGGERMPDALDRAIQVRESFDLPTWGAFAQQPWVRAERHKNQRARQVGSPSVAEIVAIRLDAICNTGDLIVHLEAVDGAVWEWRCNGHTAGERLRVDRVEPASERGPLSRRVGGRIHSWVGYPQSEGDNSPPVYQPHHELVVTTKVTRYEDLYGDARKGE